MGGDLEQPTVARTIRALAARFKAAGLAFGHGTHNARDEAAWLVMHVLRIAADQLRSQQARTLIAVETRRIDRLAERRLRERIPLAYLVREAWLGDFRFYVDQRVIVPRSFIGEILEDGIAPLLRGPVRRALDLCTGSGCLAIVLAHAFPRALVDAADLSSAAMSVALRNVSDYRLKKRIRLLPSDLFDALGGRRYDLIVSNPPYVSAKSMAALPAEYLREPRMSLAGGRDGLLLVHRILTQAKRHLRPRGALVCEIGHNRASLERAYPRVPFTWLETSAGDGFVFLLEREQLPL